MKSFARSERRGTRSGILHQKGVPKTTFTTESWGQRGHKPLIELSRWETGRRPNSAPSSLRYALPLTLLKQRNGGDSNWSRMRA